MPIVTLLLAGVFSSALIPLIIRFAHKHKLYDRINERKIHNGNIPRLGGVGITLAFMGGLLIIVLMDIGQANDFYGRFRVWPIFVTGSVIFLTGLVDDFIDLRASFKLIIQTFAALVLIVYGLRFEVIMVPWGDGKVDLGLFSFPLTLAWIIGVTNAINLIDGLDGLAAGTSIIASITFGIFYWTQGMVLQAEICFTIAGAAIGFLIFNWHPAKIFMGDSGSLFLGFSLAMLPLLGQRHDRAEIGLISAATTLAIPIFDTLIAVYRRKKAHLSFFMSDKSHFHHILLAKYNSTTKAVGTIYFLNLFLSIVALSTIYLGKAWSFLLKLVVIITVGTLIFVLNMKRERSEKT
ncbi:MAG: MraY family glycosyltransferase [Spirochaetes bacterium]|nr:MraY family glycosyltransferase [Spirochaetota bacterium]